MTGLSFLAVGDGSSTGPALAELLWRECAGLGIDGRLVDAPPPPAFERLDVLVGDAASFALPAAFAEDAPRRARTLVVVDGAPGDDDVRRLVAALPGIGLVLSTDNATARTLGARGAPAHFLPLGRSAALTRDRDARPLAAVVVGRPTERRAVAARALGAALGKEVAVVAADPDTVARARVAVLVHADREDAGIDWFGAITAIQAGTALVAERALGLLPLQAGRDLLSASPAALPEITAALLADDDLRAALTRSATTLLDGAPPMASTVGQLAGQAWEIQAATWRGAPGRATV